MLHGRTRERALLDAVVDGARRAGGGALVLRGEPGVGKSALLGAVVQACADVVTLRANGAPAESGMPFAHLHQLLQPLLAGLDRLPAVQRSALGSAFGIERGEAPDRFAVALATLTLLADAAADGPLLCVVDDAQWLDQETADVLVFVARRIEREPIAVLLATTRSIGAAAVEHAVTEVSVARMERRACEELVAERIGRAPAADVADALWASSGGNPLTLIEATDSLSTAQLDGRAPLPGRWEQGIALHEALLRRTRDLPASTREVLLVAAAEERGDAGCVLRACRQLGLDGAALAPAEETAIVAVGEGRITFCHPMMRTAVYQAAPFGERQSVHRALADVLAAGDADRSAWHRSAAVVGHDDAVADELDRAAVRARERGGHNAASLAAQRASDLTADGEHAGRRMLAAAGDAWTAGDVARCSDLLAQARPLVGEPSSRADLERLGALVESVGGDRRVAFQALLTADRELRGRDQDRSIQLLVDAGHLAWSDADLAGLSEVARRLVALDVAPDAPAAFGVGVLIGLGAVLRGDTATGIPALRTALFSVADDPTQLHVAGTAAMFVGDDRVAGELLSRAVARLRSAGRLNALPHSLANLAALETWGGDTLTARVLATETVALARETGQAQHTAAGLALLAWLDALGGGDGATFGREAIELARRHRVRRPLAIATWADALAAVGAGRWAEAIDPLAALANDHSNSYHPTVALMSAGDLIETAHRLDRPAVGWAALQRLDQFVERSGSAWAGAVAARAHALLADDDAVAEEHFARAVELHAAPTRPFDEARTRLVYGEHLRRQRRKADSREQLRTAVGIFERLGARPWEQRARAELRATGETARKRDPSTLGELTPQQLQIVRLVSEGASNKDVAAQLFLSPRTVDYHLRNVFTKLGVTSRAELIRLSLG